MTDMLCVAVGQVSDV